jgi:hypothetical protein
VVLVLLPVLLCCGGAVVGVPAVWFFGETAKASRGAASPAAAANIYLEALSYDNDAGLLPVLDDDQGDELPKQWRAYRAEMRRGGTKPSKLGIVVVGIRETGRNRAVVTTEVYPVWWSTDGRATSLHGERKPWLFTVREAKGWQIEQVDP